MKLIKLTRGKQAKVDDDDYDMLMAYKWQASFYGYAVTNTSRRSGRRVMWMHREVMRAVDGQIIDHIDGDTLNNQKSNLRFVTESQNHWNQRTRKDSKSGLKGVDSYRAKYGRWRAYIKVGKKKCHLGYFSSAELAHEAYKEAAIKHFREHARFE